jgi:acyl-CoA thioester hydrolase
MRRRGVLAASVDVVVPFHDVDAMQIVWHGHYAKYLELARFALMDKLGYGYDVMRVNGFKWPIVDLQIRYGQPAVVGQRLTVAAELVEWENRMVIDYVITDAATGARLTRASSTQVAVSVETGELRLVSPDLLLDLVQKVMT